MLTYPLNKESGRSLYEQLYEGIRRDLFTARACGVQSHPLRHESPKAKALWAFSLFFCKNQFFYFFSMMSVVS